MLVGDTPVVVERTGVILPSKAQFDTQRPALDEKPVMVKHPALDNQAVLAAQQQAKWDKCNHPRQGLLDNSQHWHPHTNSTGY